MCCLKYEQDNYDQVLKRLPRVGKDIVTPDGVGILTDINCIKETVRVRIRQEDDSFDVREYAVDDVRRMGPGDVPTVRDNARDRRPRRGQEPAPEAEKATPEEEPKRRRYPHQKAPKNLSTEQFFEQMKTSGGVTPVTVSHDHRRRRSSRPPREEVQPPREEATSGTEER